MSRGGNIPLLFRSAISAYHVLMEGIQVGNLPELVHSMTGIFNKKPSVPVHTSCFRSLAHLFINLILFQDTLKEVLSAEDVVAITILNCTTLFLLFCRS